MNSIGQSSALNGRSEPPDPINSSLNGSEAAHRSASNASNPEVVAVKRRRLISRSDNAESCATTTDARSPAREAHLLRTERVYSSMLATWRKQLASADQVAVRRGPKVNPATAQKRRDEQLNREIARLGARDRDYRGSKKLCTLLGLPIEEQELTD